MSAEPWREVDDLRRRWQTDAQLKALVEKAFDSVGFTGSFVGRTTQAGGRRKYLKDSVWGMIEFGHAEIQLIDSPLFQRLRRIRQLGFSYLVYPSAEHTRFIHSLGMAHVVSSFVASITRNANTPVTGSTQVSEYRGISALSPLAERELVFAALLHDLGHLPFSHACEAALSQRDQDFDCGGQSLGDFLAAARLAFGKTISLSETLSIVFVLSERFGAFYGRLLALEPDDAEASLVRIACLIAGVPATPNCPNIQDLISAAAVDADKIDYVTRDAAACGIAVGVDTSRIFMGSGLVNARRDAYDPSYEGEGTGTLFVVNSSGADTLDEIVQARSALYQRVYLHPVTRTAEALLARAMHLNATGTSAARRPELAEAVELWAMDDATLLSCLGTHADPSVRALAERLRLRKLPKKACALAGSLATMHMPLRSIFPRMDPTEASSIRKDLANTFIEKLRRDHIVELGTSAIEERIREEARSLAQRLRSGSQSHLVPSETLDLVIVTPIAAMDSSKPDALVFQAGELIRTPTLTNVQGQLDAQDIFKAVGYVFCDAEWRSIVLAATRRVMFLLSEETSGGLVEHSLSTVKVGAKRRTILEFEGVTRRANIPRSTAERVMDAAADVGYFDDIPILCPPTDPVAPTVQAAARAFRGFLGEEGWSIDRTTVAAFVDQFPKRLRPDMLSMLGQGVILDQASLSRSLIEAIGKVRGGAEPVVICPLSASSGGEAMTIIGARGLPGVRCCSSLKEALAEPNEPLILLVDDNSASGVQASAQLYAYAGTDKPNRPERLRGEDGLFERSLQPSDVEDLRRRRFAVVVAAGLEGADALVRDAARDLSLERFEGVHHGSRIADGLVWPGPLRAHLEDIGRELLAYRYERLPFSELRDDEVRRRCEERAFGYGGRGGIMATHGNVPSSTVTALWQPGMVRGRPWMPLLIRRGLLKDLTLG